MFEIFKFIKIIRIKKKIVFKNSGNLEFSKKFLSKSAIYAGWLTKKKRFLAELPNVTYNGLMNTQKYNKT